MTRPSTRRPGALADLRGGARLVIDGVRGVTGLVEAMHSRIARVPMPLGQVPDMPTTGITGLVYRSIQGTTGVVGKAIDAALAGVEAVLPAASPDAAAGRFDAERDAAVAALNGVMGDHLERSGNPLATPMALRVRPADAARGPRVLLLVHGLCMTDHQWTRDGHDHGQALAEAGGWTPVYARYNTGRHISTNGAEMAAQVEQLLDGWPVPVEDFAVIGHSMGGLVMRSALQSALHAGMRWPAKLRRLVFLGTPHHGAPLERGGNWLHRGLGVSPYVAPFTRLSGLRSFGITDLRHGNLQEQDWADDRFTHRDTRAALPLPSGVACYAIAGTLGEGRTDEWLGDGLVPLASALGRHSKPTRDLHIPASRQWVARGVNHLDLLASDAVYRRLKRWLGPANPRDPA
ncbi:GPI inositol-deacylase [Ramlibacter sp. WS9]|uniref:lipase family alpha/beta hydrolase n=1 Tax=Ramlibacter sp. WS9 TaxID=1882741 RepID=UPI001E36AFB6|nr:GPI inositol-deacylase [Ramlibacter sp. WS9]